MSLNLIEKITLFLLILFTIGCEKNSTEPTIIDKSNTISDINRIIWTIESFQIGGNAIDISHYLPFNLVYDDSTFLGDDGCNKFSGIYETKGDTVIPDQIGITLLDCDIFNIFPWDHLISPYRYDVNLKNGKIALYHSDSVYTYKSNYLEDIDSLLINKNWILLIDAHVILTFDGNRSFKAEYDCGDSNMGCGNMQGFYGIGVDDMILFYVTGAGGSGLQWYHYLLKVLKSSSYSLENSTLILYNEIDSLTFEFILNE